MYYTYTHSQLFLGVVLLIIFAAGLTYGIMRFVISRQQSIIPSAIQEHIAFQILAPNTSSKIWKMPKNLINYDTQQGTLSITTIGDHNELVMSEQQTPQIFTNIPQYFPTLLGKLNQYGQFQTSLGDVELTHPTELHGNQTAVLNSSGTLVFVRPQYNLSVSQWTSYFNNLIVVR